MKSFVLTLGAVLAVAAGAAEAPWAMAGRQGIVQYVVVPAELAADRAAYDAQIAQICPPKTTCFVNFYTNSRDAPVGMPLPEAIANEPTALFRRSMKIGAEQFQWSCRVKPGEQGCF